MSKRVPSTVPDTPCFIVHYGDHYSPYIFPSIELKFLHGPDTWHLHSMVIWRHCASVKSKSITISIVSLILFLLRLLNASVLRTLGTSELPRIAECQKHMSSFTEHCIKQKTAPYQHLPLWSRYSVSNGFVRRMWPKATLLYYLLLPWYQLWDFRHVIFFVEMLISNSP